MSSISLPKVLHSRKSTEEIERESFEKFQTASITKAINQSETPVKEKHVRIAIIGTFRNQNAELFWQNVLRLPLEENRIVAWKFCHVLHKLLREGHPSTIRYSQKHRKKIECVGRLWGHLKEGYGKLILLYCQLLLRKLYFHNNNPGFPGNLVLSDEELERLGENDINVYFEMAVEMFDYLDDILALQSAIFGSLDMSRSNSMTSSGQCRLAPLIPCIQDSSQLYDFCVKIMFKLYAQLPPDTLAGHRERFIKQFQMLRQFYMASATLQYFKNLIQIPQLPEHPPNILVHAELMTYVTPTPVVMNVPEEADDAVSHMSSELVDIANNCSCSNECSCNRDMSAELINERDTLIEHLQNELLDCRTFMCSLEKRVNELELSLTEKSIELSKEIVEKNKCSSLMNELKLKNDQDEEKLKAQDEKFNKLKDVYAKLRDEHIQLIRQKAGIEKELKRSDKMTKFARAANHLINSIKADVDKQLANVKNIESQSNERAKLEEELATLQAAADAANDQNQTLMFNMELATQEKNLLQSSVQELLSTEKELKAKVKQFQERSDKNTTNMFDKCRELVQFTLDQINVADSTTTFIPHLLENIKEKLIKITATNDDQHPILLSHYTSIFILFGKATANTLPDLDVAEKVIVKCKDVGRECLQLLDAMNGNTCDLDYGAYRTAVSDLMTFGKPQQNGTSPEVLSDLVENELITMDKAIEEAAARIEELLRNSREKDSGLKLEVNEKILDSCTSLMSAVRILVQKSRILQAEIVPSGNTSNMKEFYKRNHQWTEGLISAAKAVGMGAKYMLFAADEVVSGNGKLERVMVAAQGVAASTAQLVVASRVKADRNSANLVALSAASKDVTHGTGNVVATVKMCAQLVEESEDLDFSGLSLHQAKRLEMDSQVRVLELESGLEKERLKLAALRRCHYQLSGDLDKR